MKLYSLTKLNGDKVAVCGAVEKEGFLFLTSPEEEIDTPVYGIKFNHEFIRFCKDKLFDREDIRDS